MAGTHEGPRDVLQPDLNMQSFIPKWRVMGEVLRSGGDTGFLP